MTNLVRAKELLQQGDLISSLELFQKANDESGYSDFEKVYILDSLHEISISLGRAKNLETLKKISQGYFQVFQYRKSLLLCEEALKLSEEFDLFELQIKNHHALGNIDSVERSVVNFVNLLIKKKDTIKSLEILNRERRYLPHRTLWLLKTKCYILMGDIDSIERVIDNLKVLQGEDYLELIKLFEINTLYWNRSEIIRLWILDSLTISVDNRYIPKKYVVKLLSDIYFYTNGIENKLLEDTLAVSEKWGLYGLGYTISLLINNSDKENYFLSKLPTELLSDQNFDLGKDFVSKDNDLLEHEYVNKIMFLESVGNKAESIKERLAFKNKFPKSSLLNNTKNLVTQESKNDINKTLDEITKRGEKNKNTKKEAELHVSFENMNNEDLYVNYSEIISTLNMLKEYGKVIKLTDILLKDLENGDVYLDVAYLKIEALLQDQRYFEARDLSEKIILENPLSQDKKCTFDYLLAESYFRLKEYDKSRCIFMEIFKINKTYRLTKNRLKVIEENK